MEKYGTKRGAVNVVKHPDCSGIRGPCRNFGQSSLSAVERELQEDCKF